MKKAVAKVRNEKYPGGFKLNFELQNPTNENPEIQSDFEKIIAVHKIVNENFGKYMVAAINESDKTEHSYFGGMYVPVNLYQAIKVDLEKLGYEIIE